MYVHGMYVCLWQDRSGNFCPSTSSFGRFASRVSDSLVAKAWVRIGCIFTVFMCICDQIKWQDSARPPHLLGVQRVEFGCQYLGVVAVDAFSLYWLVDTLHALLHCVQFFIVFSMCPDQSVKFCSTTRSYGRVASGVCHFLVASTWD